MSKPTEKKCVQSSPSVYDDAYSATGAGVRLQKDRISEIDRTFTFTPHRTIRKAEKNRQHLRPCRQPDLIISRSRIVVVIPALEGVAPHYAAHEAHLGMNGVG